MSVANSLKVNLLHVGVIVLLAVLFLVLPEYHVGILARILVLTIYAMGFNLLFGYTGLLSLGHALYFAAGLYATGLSVQYLDAGVLSAFVAGIAGATLVSVVIGMLALRTTGVAFMIVTLMFAQAGFLTLLYFNRYTRGDEGFVLQQASRQLSLGSLNLDLTHSDTRFWIAWALFSLCLTGSLWIVRSGYGRVLIAIRENEERTRLLGYNPQRYKLIAFLLSGLYCGIAGAAYALLFGYVGATFASTQYSILPLLWVLLGGAGTILGPLLGTVSMFYLTDYLSELTSAWMLFVGIALVLIILIAPHGLLGSLRERHVRWLP